MSELGKMSTRDALDMIRKAKAASASPGSVNAITYGPPNGGWGGGPITPNPYPYPPITTVPNTAGTWYPPNPAVMPPPAPILEHDQVADSSGEVYDVEQLNSNADDLAELAVWVGGMAVGSTGIRVPTLEGVEVAFPGDWIARNVKTGIVRVLTQSEYDDELSFLA